MKNILIITLLSILSPCFAGSVYFGMYTDHAVVGDFNEVNRVVVARFDNGLTVGKMINSYNRPSNMFGYTTSPEKLVSFGLVLATGYEPENIYMDGKIDSLPVLPLPVVTLNMPISDSTSITANLIGGVVINTGLNFRF